MAQPTAEQAALLRRIYLSLLRASEDLMKQSLNDVDFVPDARELLSDAVSTVKRAFE
jgi:hypothetical protein